MMIKAVITVETMESTVTPVNYKGRVVQMHSKGTAYMDFIAYFYDHPTHDQLIHIIDGYAPVGAPITNVELTMNYA